MGKMGKIGKIGRIGLIGSIRREHQCTICSSTLSSEASLFILCPCPPRLAPPNLLSEGCRVLHSAKMPPMGSTWCTSHWWHFLLGDAIDPLSQQISCSRRTHNPHHTHAHRSYRHTRRSRSRPVMQGPQELRRVPLQPLPRS